MSRDQEIYKKVNEAIRTLADIYELLSEDREAVTHDRQNNRDFLTIKGLCEKHPIFSQPMIRNYIHQNMRDFKEKVCVRVGKRIYIKEGSFFEWIAEGED